MSENDIGARCDEVLVAAFQSHAAEICGRQMPLLEHGAHGAVKDEDAGVERLG